MIRLCISSQAGYVEWHRTDNTVYLPVACDFTFIYLCTFTWIESIRLLGHTKQAMSASITYIWATRDAADLVEYDLAGSQLQVCVALQHPQHASRGLAGACLHQSLAVLGGCWAGPVGMALPGEMVQAGDAR
jgi:hypothetical protein